MDGTKYAEGIYSILKGVDKVLGGGNDFSTGIDYRNDTFETHSYWAHCEDCTCGLEDREAGFEDWFEKKYGSWEKHYGNHVRWDDYYREHLNYFQGEELTHAEDCGINLPGFLHYASGLRVDWYKRVGRSTEANKILTDLEWYRIVVECLESLKVEFAGH